MAHHSTTHGSAERRAASRHELPPSAPLPAWLQTLALRLFPVSYLEGCRARLGPRFSIRVLDMPPLVVLCDPAEIDVVLRAPPSFLRPGIGTELIAPLIGEQSFILSDRPERRDVRAAAAPALRGGDDAAYAQLVAAITREEIASWPLEQTVALYPRLSALTLRVILTVLLGEHDEDVERLGRRVLAMLSVARSIVIQEPRLRSLPGWHRTWRRFESGRVEVDALLARIVARGRRQPRAHSHSLDSLLGVGEDDDTPPSDKEVADNLLSLIVAGHETTAAALSWTFLMLAHNPEAQARLVAEIDDGTSEEYLSATVRETLRRGPVFLFAIPRAVVAPFEVGGVTYRPPTHLLASTYLMHNDAEHYPEPTAFQPERFLGAAPAPLTWKPWGGGRRRCLGHALAELEIRTVIKETLQNCAVSTQARRLERATWRTVIVAPHAGGRVVLHRREVPGVITRDEYAPPVTER